VIFFINKMNNHISYSLTEHKKMTIAYDVRDSCPGLGQALNCGRVKLVKKYI